MHCIENFFTVQHFWTTCLCPEKQFSLNFFTVLIIHFFYHSEFLSNLPLPWKTDLTWNSSLYWYICIIQDFWATCVCPENFHCIEYTFHIQDFWATCACPEKQSVPWIHLLNAYFLSFRIFEQLALALKNRVALKFFTVLKNFFIIHEFWATCACPENRVCPEIFHWIEIFFIIQEFWATCPCPENRICPENFQASWRQPPRRHPPRTPTV